MKRKIQVIVIAVDAEQLRDYSNLFIAMTEPKRVIRSQQTARIETEEADIRFIVKPSNNGARGLKCDYLINLSRDNDFHNMWAIPMMCSRRKVDEEDSKTSI